MLRLIWPCIFSLGNRAFSTNVRRYLFCIIQYLHSTAHVRKNSAADLLSFPCLVIGFTVGIQVGTLCLWHVVIFPIKNQSKLQHYNPWKMCLVEDLYQNQLSFHSLMFEKCRHLHLFLSYSPLAVQEQKMFP